MTRACTMLYKTEASLGSVCIPTRTPASSSSSHSAKRRSDRNSTIWPSSANHDILAFAASSSTSPSASSRAWTSCSSGEIGRAQRLPRPLLTRTDRYDQGVVGALLGLHAFYTTFPEIDTTSDAYMALSPGERYHKSIIQGQLLHRRHRSSTGMYADAR